MESWKTFREGRRGGPRQDDALEWLRKHLDAEGSDLLREMVRTFAERFGHEGTPFMSVPTAFMSVATVSAM